MIGKGLSIGLLTRASLKRDQWDLSNFFKHGDRVPVPSQSDQIGFLSESYLPYLWNVGARPNISEDDSNKIFEILISLASIAKGYFKIDFKPLFQCLNPYQELLYFIRHKMIYYFRLAQDKIDYKNWPWINLIQNLRNDHNITIISYNYDIWLEQALLHNDIPFYRAGIEEQSEPEQLQLIKPHGSIDLKQKIDISLKYSFPLKNLIISDNTSDITEIIPQEKLDEIVPQVDLIPPMGSANDGRIETYCNWSDKAHSAALNACQSTTHLIISGLSYYLPDRPELNDILRNIPISAKVDLIDPEPNKVFVDILQTLYTEYHHFKSIDQFISELS